MTKNDLNKVWNEIVVSLKPLFENENIYQTCFVPTKVLNLENKILQISVPSIFAKSILTNDFKKEIDELLTAKMNVQLFVSFLLPEEQKLVKFDDKLINEKTSNNLAKANLNSEYSLDNFIVGEFNKSAYNAVCAISNKLGTIYNPLFIYGSTGLGKTHLMMSLGNLFATRYPDKRVKYIESDVFIRDVFAAISKGGNFVEELKDYYSSIDLLLIDDIQYLSGKEKTNEIFFSIFNNLVKHNKQIVITSDKAPDFLDSLEERMVSRFNSGLTIKIAKPEIDALKRIVLQKISQSDSAFKFEDEAIGEIVKYYDNDLRKLIGAINQISFYAIQNLNPNQIITKTFINQFIEENSTAILHYDMKVNPEIVISSICKWYAVKEDLIKGNSRLKNLVNVRHICMYVLRTKFHLSLSEIGKLFSNRDHTTVMNAVEKITKQIESDDNLKNYIDNSIIKI